MSYKSILLADLGSDKDKKKKNKSKLSSEQDRRYKLAQELARITSYFDYKQNQQPQQQEQLQQQIQPQIQPQQPQPVDFRYYDPLTNQAYKDTFTISEDTENILLTDINYLKNQIEEAKRLDAQRRLLEGIEKFSKAPVKLGDVEIGTYGQFSKFKDTSADKEFLNKLQEYNKLYDEYENANKIGDKNKAIELKAELDKRLSKLKSSNPFYFHNLDVDEYLTQDPDIHFTGWKLQRPFLKKYPVDEKYFDYNKTIAPHRTINKMPSIVRNTVGGLTSGVIMSTVESAYNIGRALTDIAGITDKRQKDFVGEIIEQATLSVTPDEEYRNFLYDLGSGFGSMLSFFFMGRGIAWGVGKGLKLLNKTPKIKTLEKIVSGTMVGTEALMEGGFVYKQTKDLDAAFKTTLANVVVIYISNRLGLRNPEQVAMLKRVLATAPLEGIQEGAQEIISALAEGRELDDETLNQVLKAAGIGAIVGGVSATFMGPKKDPDDITTTKQKQPDIPDVPPPDNLPPAPEQQPSEPASQMLQLEKPTPSEIIKAEQEAISNVGVFNYANVIANKIANGEELNEMDRLTYAKHQEMIDEMAEQMKKDKSNEIIRAERDKRALEGLNDIINEAKKSNKNIDLEYFDKIAGITTPAAKESVEKLRAKAVAHNNKINAGSNNYVNEINRRFENAKRNRRLVDIDALEELAKYTEGESKVKAEEFINSAKQYNQQLQESNKLTLENLSRALFKKDISELNEKQQKKLVDKYNELKERNTTEIRDISPSIQKVKPKQKIKELEDAIQERSTEEVLQRKQEEVGETGRQRRGMEQSFEGIEATEESQQQELERKSQEEAKVKIKEALENIEKIKAEGKQRKAKVNIDKDTGLVSYYDNNGELKKIDIKDAIHDYENLPDEVKQEINKLARENRELFNYLTLTEKEKREVEAVKKATSQIEEYDKQISRLNEEIKKDTDKINELKNKIPDVPSEDILNAKVSKFLGEISEEDFKIIDEINVLRNNIKNKYREVLRFQKAKNRLKNKIRRSKVPKDTKEVKKESEFAKDMQIQLDIMQKAGLSEEDILNYANSTVADGGKLRQYLNRVKKGELTVEEAADLVKNDYAKLKNIVEEKEEQLQKPEAKKEQPPKETKEKQPIDSEKQSETEEVKKTKGKKDLIAGGLDELKEKSQTRKDRERGVKIVDGVEYRRNDKIPVKRGKKTKVVFNINDSVEGEYAVISANDLIPSHILKDKVMVVNPQHFIPEAQPKRRQKSETSAQGVINIRDNIDPTQLGESPNAYFGAPIINERGEVIQGNNRSAGIKAAYESGKGDKYKQYLIDNAEKFGLKPEDIEQVENPVLVRILPLNDEEAIHYGQKTAADLESGDKKVLSPQRIVKQMSDDIAVKFLNILSQDITEDLELPAIISLKADDLAQLLAENNLIDQSYIKEFLVNKSGQLNAEFTDLLKNITISILFKYTDAETQLHFERMPQRLQTAIIKALPYIITTSTSGNLMHTLVGAIKLYGRYEQYLNSNKLKQSDYPLNLFLGQINIFSGESENQYYTVEEIALAVFLLNNKTSTHSEIIKPFRYYASYVKGKPETLFEDEFKPLDSQEAFEKAFENTFNDAIEIAKKLAYDPNKIKDELKKKGLTDGQIERGSSLREQLNQITKDIADERRNTRIEQENTERKVEDYESKAENIERKEQSENPNEINEAAEESSKLKKSRKSDIDKRIDDAIKDFNDEFNNIFKKFNSFLVPIEPNLLLKGAKVVKLYCEKGVYRLADILNDFMERIGAISDEMLAAIKQAYINYRKSAPNEIAEKMDSKIDNITFNYQRGIYEISETTTDRPEQGLTGTSRQDIGAARGSQRELVYVGEVTKPETDFVEGTTAQIDEHQKLAVNLILDDFINKEGNAFLLSDGAGVGKTRIMLTVAKYINDNLDGDVLIVTENDSVIEAFKRENKAGNINANMTDKLEANIQEPHVKIVDYDTLSANKIKKGNYKLIIYDEAHNLKNREAKKTLASENLKADYIIYATATPMDTLDGVRYFLPKLFNVSEEEILNILGIEEDTEINPLTNQIKQYYKLREGITYDYVYNTLINLRNELIKNGKMLRREYKFKGAIQVVKTQMSNELKDLENKVYEHYSDKISRVKYVNRLSEEEKQKIIMAYGTKRKNELEAISEISKFEIILRNALEDLNNGKQVVIFAERISPTKIEAADTYVDGLITRLEAAFNQRGYKVAKVYGNDQAQKIENADKFQKGEYKIAIGTPASMSTGINLDDQVGNAPRVVYIATLNYSPIVNEQMLGRVSRKNTKSNAEVYYVVTNSFNDARRENIVINKINIMSSLQRGQIIEGENIYEQLVSREKIIPKVIELNENQIGVENAYTIKEELKKLGARFDKYSGLWILDKSNLDDVNRIISSNRNYMIERQGLEDGIDRENLVELLQNAGIEVITDEEVIKKKLEEDTRLKQLEDKNKVVYGFVEGNKIYLVKDRINLNTTVHEYTHLWFEALKINNKALYDKAIKVLEGTKTWSEVENDEAYKHLKGNKHAIASEVLARLSGRSAVEIAKQEREKTKVQKILEVLKEFWQWVKNIFTRFRRLEAEQLTLKELINMPIRDLTKGVNLGEILYKRGQEQSKLDKISKEIHSYLQQLLKGFGISIPTRYYNIAVPENQNTIKLFRIFQKRFGERAAKVIRAKAGFGFDYGERFADFLEKVIPDNSQVATIIDKVGHLIILDFKKEIGFVDKSIISLEDPIILASENNYSFIETRTPEEVYSFRSDYREDKDELICTIKNHQAPSRLEDNYIFWLRHKNADRIPPVDKLSQDNITPEWDEYLTKKGRKNADGTYNLEGLKKEREDPYSLSSLCVQVRKDGQDVKIISRYNHRIASGNPDYVYGGDLDSVIAGLKNAVEKYYNLKLSSKNDVQDDILSQNKIFRTPNGEYIHYYSTFYKRTTIYYVANNLYVKDNRIYKIDPNNQVLFDRYLIGREGNDYYIYDLQGGEKLQQEIENLSISPNLVTFKIKGDDNKYYIARGKRGVIISAYLPFDEFNAFPTTLESLRLDNVVRLDDTLNDMPSFKYFRADNLEVVSLALNNCDILETITCPKLQVVHSSLNNARNLRELKSSPITIKHSLDNTSKLGSIDLSNVQVIRSSFNESGLRSVKTNTVRDIIGSFRGCHNLTEVFLGGDGIKIDRIIKDSFRSCDSLQNVVVRAQFIAFSFNSLYRVNSGVIQAHILDYSFNSFQADRLYVSSYEMGDSFNYISDVREIAVYNNTTTKDCFVFSNIQRLYMPDTKNIHWSSGYYIKNIREFYIPKAKLELRQGYDIKTLECEYISVSNYTTIDQMAYSETEYIINSNNLDDVETLLAFVLLESRSEIYSEPRAKFYIQDEVYKSISENKYLKKAIGDGKIKPLSVYKLSKGDRTYYDDASNPIPTQFNRIHELKLRNPLLANFNVKFTDTNELALTREEIKRYGYSDEFINTLEEIKRGERGYEEGKQKYRVYVAEATTYNFDSKTGTILIDRQSSPSAYVEGIIHAIYKGLEDTNPDLLRRILAWEQIVSKAAAEMGLSIPKGEELFAQVMVFRHLGFGNERPDIIDALAIPEDIYNDFISLLVQNESDLSLLNPNLKDNTIPKGYEADYIGKELYQQLLQSGEYKNNDELYEAWKREVLNFQLIGKKGAERLTEAKRNELNKKMVDALIMYEAGINMETIRKETGWFLTPSNKWVTSGKNLMGKLDKAIKMEGKGKDVDVIWSKTRWEKGVGDKWRTEIDYLKFRENLDIRDFDNNGRGVKKAKFPQLFEHNDLFVAYPELYDVYVYFTTAKRDIDGVTIIYPNSAPEIIVYNIDITNPKLSKKHLETLIHETQHLIQYYEGFPSGATVEYYQDREILNPIYVRYWSEENQRRIARYNEIVNSKEFKKQRRKEVKALIKIDSMPDSKKEQELAKYIDNFSTNYPLVYEAQRLQIETLFTEPKKYLTPTEAYYLTAGESEARNAVYRSRLSENARKQLSPAVTEIAVIPFEFREIKRNELLITPYEVNNLVSYSIDTSKEAFNSLSQLQVEGEQISLEDIPLTLSVFNRPEFVKLRGRKVKTAIIKQLIRQSGIKKIEQDLINNVIDTHFKGGETVDYNLLEATVRLNLMPLEKIETTSYADFGIHVLDNERATAKTIILNSNVAHGDYGHFINVYEGTTKYEYIPLQLNDNIWVAVRSDFRRGGVTRENILDYVGTAGTEQAVKKWIEDYKGGRGIPIGLFAHYRVWEDGDIHYIAEIQSDPMQHRDIETDILKQRIEKLKSENKIEDDVYNEIKNDLEKYREHKNIYNRLVNFHTEQYGDNFKDKLKGEEYAEFHYTEAQYNNYKNKFADWVKKYLGDDLQAKQFIAYKNKWELRTIREILKDRAQAGAKKLRFPTSRTIVAIEGWSDTDIMYEIVDGIRNNLRPGDTIEYAGRLYYILESNYNDNYIVVTPRDNVIVTTIDDIVFDTVNFEIDEIMYEYGKIDLKEEDLSDIYVNYVGSLDEILGDEIKGKSKISLSDYYDTISNAIEEGFREYIKGEDNLREYFNDIGYDDVFVGDKNIYIVRTSNYERFPIYSINDEEFDIDSLLDDYVGIAKRYEEIANIVKKEVGADNFRVVRNRKGYEWYEVDITKGDYADKPIALYQKEETEGKKLNQLSEQERQELLDDINRMISDYWEIKYGEIPDANGITYLIDKVIQIDPNKADFTTIWEEAFHQSMVALAKDETARKLLLDAGWDGKGEIWDVNNNQSLRDAHEKLAKEFIEFVKSKKKERRTLKERIFGKLRDLWYQLAKLLYNKGLETKAGYFEALYSGDLKRLSGRGGEATVEAKTEIDRARPHLKQTKDITDEIQRIGKSRTKGIIGSFVRIFSNRKLEKLFGIDDPKLKAEYRRFFTSPIWFADKSPAAKEFWHIIDRYFVRELNEERDTLIEDYWQNGKAWRKLPNESKELILNAIKDYSKAQYELYISGNNFKFETFDDFANKRLNNDPKAYNFFIGVLKPTMKRALEVFKLAEVEKVASDDKNCPFLDKYYESVRKKAPKGKQKQLLSEALDTIQNESNNLYQLILNKLSQQGKKKNIAKAIEDAWAEDEQLRYAVATDLVDKKYKVIEDRVYFPSTRLNRKYGLYAVSEPLVGEKERKVFVTSDSLEELNEIKELLEKEDYKVTIKKYSDYDVKEYEEAITESEIIELAHLSGISQNNPIIDKLIKTTLGKSFRRHFIPKAFVPGLFYDPIEFEESIYQYLNGVTYYTYQTIGRIKFDKAFAKSGDTLKPSEKHYVKTLKDRMSVDESRFVNAIRAVTSLYYLALAPAYYIQQAVQPFATLLPQIPNWIAELNTQRGANIKQIEAEKLFVTELLNTFPYFGWKIVHKINRMLGKPDTYLGLNKDFIEVLKRLDKQKVARPLRTMEIFGYQVNPAKYYTNNAIKFGLNPLLTLLRIVHIPGIAIEEATRVMAIRIAYILGKRAGLRGDELLQYISDKVAQSFGASSGILNRPPDYHIEGKTLATKVAQIILSSWATFTNYSFMNYGLLGKLYRDFTKNKAVRNLVFNILARPNKLKDFVAAGEDTAVRGAFYKAIATVTMGGLKYGVPFIPTLLAFLTLIYDLFDIKEDPEEQYRDAFKKIDEATNSQVGTALYDGILSNTTDIDFSAIFSQTAPLEQPFARDVGEVIIGAPYSVARDIYKGKPPRFLRGSQEAEKIRERGLVFGRKLLEPEEVTEKELKQRSFGFTPLRFSKEYAKEESRKFKSEQYTDAIRKEIDDRIIPLIDSNKNKEVYYYFSSLMKEMIQDGVLTEKMIEENGIKGVYTFVGRIILPRLEDPAKEKIRKWKNIMLITPPSYYGKSKKKTTEYYKNESFYK